MTVLQRDTVSDSTQTLTHISPSSNGARCQSNTLPLSVCVCRAKHPTYVESHELFWSTFPPPFVHSQKGLSTENLSQTMLGKCEDVRKAYYSSNIIAQFPSSNAIGLFLLYSATIKSRRTLQETRHAFVCIVGYDILECCIALLIGSNIITCPHISM